MIHRRQRKGDEMGAIVKVFCESCGAQWECQTGCGIMHGTLDRIAPLFPEETGRVLMEYAGRSECPMFDFAFQSAVCQDCVGVVSVPVVRLHESGERYIGPCPDCGKAVRLLGDPEKTDCPVCKKNTLKTIETGRWD